MKGLTASVYTNPLYRNCANGGISETHDEVTIVGTIDRTSNLGNREVNDLPRGAQVFAPNESRPAVVLVCRRDSFNPGGTIVHAEPAPTPDGRPHYMAGGSFIHTSDSRFHEIVGFYGAVSLHDRTES